jgi:hypothetical protein
MFMNRKTEYYQDASSNQLDLQIECNTKQNANNVFCGCQQIDFKLYMED